MSVEQTRRTLNQVDKELIGLEKNLADLMKKEADKTKHINDSNRSITKSTSVSTAQSKLRQIGGWQNELSKIINNKADISKKIADKKKTRMDSVIKLQKEESAEQKKTDKTQKNIHDNYESKITDLTAQLTQQLTIIKPENHLYYENNDEQFDVFISHASEDKKSFADELRKELESDGIKVWYDTLNIAWGDSLRAKIDDGLKKSKFAIVILSKDYIRKGWTQYELDGLFQIEMTNGKTILPIWHDITKDEVQTFSPTLAGRKAMNTAMFTKREIADELEKLLEAIKEDGDEEISNG